MPTPKEKHTREQMMRLLDRAIEQEESLLKKVKILESALADCHKKVENPRHELEEQALPGSKVSFRLDYYRTGKKGPLKGIVEHLPTRESRSFEGNQLGEVGDFVAKFVGKNARPQKGTERPNDSKTRPNFPPEINENAAEVEKKEGSPLLKKLFPEFFGAPAHLPPKPANAGTTPIPAQLEAEPFWILTAGGQTHQRTVHRGEPFQIQISMQTLHAFQGKSCSVSLSAKPLEKKSATPLEIVEYCTPDEDTLNIPVRALPLEQGVYRLVVSMALRDEPQTSYYREDRLLIVQ